MRERAGSCRKLRRLARLGFPNDHGSFIAQYFWAYPVDITPIMLPSGCQLLGAGADATPIRSATPTARWATGALRALYGGHPLLARSSPTPLLRRDWQPKHRRRVLRRRAGGGGDQVFPRLWERRRRPGDLSGCRFHQYGI